MSRHSSHERSVTIGDAEFLSVIREEQCSPAMSSVNMNEIAKRPCSKSGSATKCCVCKSKQNEMSTTAINKILEEKEGLLNTEYSKKYEGEYAILIQKLEHLFQNEQVRSSFMLCEAHRERQEKIAALQNQLECKNMAALMYVLASERRKSRLEKLRIIEEYTNHISALQTLLGEGQGLILGLSRGYKTAARVDNEWREKMTKVVGEFQNFIHAFAGGAEACNQYFFDLPALLKTRASVHDDPKEDPCEEEEGSVEAPPPDSNKGTWWERLQNECRPFVVFGDMAEFKPPERRAVLKVVKGAKTAPRKWKEYVFNEMFLQTECSNLDSIKDEYSHRLPAPGPWECHEATSYRNQSQQSSRRVTPPSIDRRTTMGSILKLIKMIDEIKQQHSLHPKPHFHSTAQNESHNEHHDRATLLAARDSMEIASSTKILKERRRASNRGDGKVVLNIRDRAASIFADDDDDDDEDDKPQYIPPPSPPTESSSDEQKKAKKEDSSLSGVWKYGGSLEDIEKLKLHVAPKVNIEKVCPMDQCKRMQVDSFMRALPPYMRASPFTRIEQTLEGYDACSPEQLKILRERIENKKKKQRQEFPEPDPLAEWQAQLDADGVGVQTSVDSLSRPPCSCHVPSPTPASSVSNGQVYDMKDLVPVKQLLDHVQQACLYDDRIEFDRFRVIGHQNGHETKGGGGELGRSRFEDIKRILQQHPSLCEIFDGNTKC